MTWELQSANKQDDTCVIVYSRTIQKDDGEDFTDTRTVRHYRNSRQTVAQWYANIRREIAADLSDLNKEDNRPAETDITSRVR